MKLKIEIGKHDFLNYVAVCGLEKTKKNEKMATKIMQKLLKKRMLSSSVLNNWKGDTLVIRYATNAEELSILFDAILKDVKLSKNHEERSLLY